MRLQPAQQACFYSTLLPNPCILSVTDGLTHIVEVRQYCVYNKISSLNRKNNYKGAQEKGSIVELFHLTKVIPMSGCQIIIAIFLLLSGILMWTKKK